MARAPVPDDEGKPASRPGDDGDDRQSRVGNALRKAYDDALAEPVPDIFADLLHKLG